MTDLAAFNISAFPAGQQNLRLVTGIPAAASAGATPDSDTAAADDDSETDSETDTDADSLLPALPIPLLGGLLPPPSPPPSPPPASPPPYLPWTNASTVLQLRFPPHSANPAALPVGGAEFYAAPLAPALAQAHTAALRYSVFFPADFAWVKAGKLPGLYGGRAACSGGDRATDCFSTRIMWRGGGEGELYLYAPKDRQTASLCADPRSVCDAAYGFSVGRGAFAFRAGGWTTLVQTVRLNTPGRQDGGFVLEVDGRVVIRREDVFYRDGPPGAASSGAGRRAPSRAQRRTFFGGHGAAYETPREQYVWFKDFALVVDG
ncbi:hypothetical protein B0H15DRAFT_783570 [Mycena belliarum]|uniref:Polysaccharide lyase 14 domain-containing protein n=1 Tax=Mycena belliarum TaxID=1033014 RepID=A0AAD6XQ02_9AGAR|nr:hypothetical protein B0H15DRAFT_783570 [Mycena belliae]